MNVTKSIIFIIALICSSTFQVDARTNKMFIKLINNLSKEKNVNNDEVFIKLVNKIFEKKILRIVLDYRHPDMKRRVSQLDMLLPAVVQIGFDVNNFKKSSLIISYVGFNSVYPGLLSPPTSLKFDILKEYGFVYNTN